MGCHKHTASRCSFSLVRPILEWPSQKVGPHILVLTASQGVRLCRQVTSAVLKLHTLLHLLVLPASWVVWLC